MEINRTEPLAAANAGTYELTYDLLQLTSGFGATHFIPERLYTARGDITLEHHAAGGDVATDTFQNGGADGERRTYSGTEVLYDAAEDAPFDVIERIDAIQQPTPPGDSLNAGGFISFTPAIRISTTNLLGSNVISVDGPGTELQLMGTPKI